jgi:hypothetical protein
MSHKLFVRAVLFFPVSLFTSIARALRSSPIVLNDEDTGAVASQQESASSSSSSSSVVPVSMQIAAKLNQQVLAVYGEFLSDDGRSVDYVGMAKSDAFAAYVAASRELRQVDAAQLTVGERMAFFINLYNMLEIHARIHHAVAASDAALKSVKARCCYRVGAHLLTLEDIEHGILRDNRRPPYNPARRFLPSDAAAALCVKLDPRIHFALVCGAKSCPPVRIFKPENLERALDLAAQAFCNDPGNVHISTTSGAVRLSMIFRWYSGDFEGNYAEPPPPEPEVHAHTEAHREPPATPAPLTDYPALRFVLKHLKHGQLKADIEGLLKAGSPFIEWIPYDWSTNTKA